MFEAISGTQQALLWLAVIMAAGFTGFTLFAIVPLVKILHKQNSTIHKILDFYFSSLRENNDDPK